MSTKMKNASRPETLTPLLAPCLYGSQALLRVFDKHRAEFEDAVKEDTKVLRDEIISQAKAALPAVCSGGLSDACTALYKTKRVSKLPFRLEICNCNEHELKDYVSKLIRVDILEHEGKPVSRIAWGKS